jgi:hypothetical protein
MSKPNLGIAKPNLGMLQMHLSSDDVSQHESVSSKFENYGRATEAP